MNTNPEPVVITNYEESKRYFELFPEQLMQNEGDNEQRHDNPSKYNQFPNYRVTKWHLKHHNTQWIYHIINWVFYMLSYYNTNKFGLIKITNYQHM